MLLTYRKISLQELDKAPEKSAVALRSNFVQMFLCDFRRKWKNILKKLIITKLFTNLPILKQKFINSY